jgi:hypothetical protein
MGADEELFCEPADGCPEMTSSICAFDSESQTPPLIETNTLMKEPPQYGQVVIGIFR